MKSKCKSPRAVALTAALLISTTVLPATAQSWTNRYNGPGNAGDRPYAIAVDGSDNVYVTGWSQGGSSDGDFATIKYSSAGATLWTQRYNGALNGNDGASAIAVDGSGNVYVTGSTTGAGEQNYDYTTIKYSSTGLPLWTRFYDGPGHNRDVPNAIAVDSSGSVYVTGESANASPFDYDYLDYATVAYSSAGVQLWTRRYNGPENYRDSPAAIAVDGSGNVYVTGLSMVGPQFGGGTGDYATIAYSSAGVPLWTNRYNGPGNGHDAGVAIAVDSSGNVYVAGIDSPTTNRYRWDYFTIAYTSAGVLRWTQRYNGPANGSDEAHAIAVDGNGNVYVTGYSPGSGTGYDCVTIKYSSGGVALWTNRYNGPENGDEFAVAIAVDGSGHVYVTGNSGPGSGYLTIAYTTAGEPLWTRSYRGPGNWAEQAEAIAVGSSGSVYVTGYSVGSGSGEDYATIKYVPPLVDHFIYDPIPSPQAVDVPFPVTITARSLSGSNFTAFTDTVTLSGKAPGLIATNLTLGTATSSWGYPLYTRYHDARTQVIYRDSEVGMACTINSLALEVTTPPGQALENWTIRMKHTSLSQYPSTPEWESTGWTVVYQGSEPAGTTGWRTFEFDTPFEYDGTNNLLVDFSFNNASYSSEGQCRSTTTSTYRSITFATDSAYGDPLTWSGITPTPVRGQTVPTLVLGVTFPDLLPVSLSPITSGPFVNGVWTGSVTVHEAVTNLMLRAHTGEGVEGESNPFDVQGVAQPPVIVTDDGQMGITNGSFGFNVQGPAGQVVVIEVSSNLVDWLPLQTNTLGSGPFYFSDADTSNFIQRFYRAVMH